MSSNNQIGSVAWGPGQLLPISSGESTFEDDQYHPPIANYPEEPSSNFIPPSQPFISVMMRLFQSSLEREFQKLSSKMDNVLERMDTLENAQHSLEEQMINIHGDERSSGTPKTPLASGKRRQLTPVALQVYT